MQYGHIALADRRDTGLDAAGSFHQNGLGQALLQYNRTSPPEPLAFAVQQQQSPTVKRKHLDLNPHLNKRRRAHDNHNDDPDAYDLDPAAQGAKHWTDDEKTKLFTWLMGPGQEDHWNSLRATKNSCLRECAVQVFGGKKTYQALKGCYERNFNLFKQIYAFETAHGQPNTNISQLPEADRLREYERRLQIARKGGSDVGNITARTIDHWQRVGWYDLFYRRWHGDPATVRPVQVRTATAASSAMSGPNDEPEDEDGVIDFGDPSLNGLNGISSHDRQHVYVNPQDLRENSQQQQQPPTVPQQQQATPSISLRQPPPPQPQQQQQQQHHSQPPPVIHHTPVQQHPQPPLPPPPQPIPAPSSSASAAMGADQAMTLALNQDLVSRCLHYLNLQSQLAQEKLDYLRRREAREVSEYNAKRESEKSADAKNMTEKAFMLINNTTADPALRQAATEYLRKLFLQN